MCTTSIGKMSDKKLFREAIGYVFTQWTGLQLAIEHGMGGPNAREKERWMADVVEDFFEKNDDLNAEEVEYFISEIMDNEFDTVIEDGSSQAVAKKLCEYYGRCQRGEDVSKDWVKENDKNEQAVLETAVLSSRMEEMAINETDGWTVVTHKKHK